MGVAISLQSNAFLSAELVVLSGAGLIPAVLGMILGQRVRQRMSEVMFRRVFLIALVLLGVYIGAFSLIKFAS